VRVSTARVGTPGWVTRCPSLMTSTAQAESVGAQHVVILSSASQCLSPLITSRTADIQP
jgi:hypothetical protein